MTQSLHDTALELFRSAIDRADPAAAVRAHLATQPLAPLEGRAAASLSPWARPRCR